MDLDNGAAHTPSNDTSVVSVTIFFLCEKVPYISSTPYFCVPRNRPWWTKKCLKNPHTCSTFCGMGANVILLPDIPMIVKNQIKKKKCVMGCMGPTSLGFIKF